LFLIRNSRSFQKIAWEVYPLESWLPEREEKIKFIDNKSIRKQIVGVTCETCAVKNCKERASAPIQLELKTRNENTELIVQKHM
jgi:hypothetical protein